MVDQASGTPAYRQVAADLRDRINRGDLPSGARLPSEHELAEQHGISRPTVREAFALLRSEGLVRSERGRGYFVRDHRTVQRLARNRLSHAARQRDQGAFKADAAAGGWTPSTEVRVYFERADAVTAAALRLAEGREVCVRDRVMSADGIPVQLAASRLPREITRDTAIEDTDTGPGGLYARLEDGGHTLDHFVETVSARMATHDEQAALHLPEGTPVIFITRIAYDTGGRPLEVNAMTVSADRYELVYELPAD